MFIPVCVCLCVRERALKYPSVTFKNCVSACVSHMHTNAHAQTHTYTHKLSVWLTGNPVITDTTTCSRQTHTHTHTHTHVHKHALTQTPRQIHAYKNDTQTYCKLDKCTMHPCIDKLGGQCEGQGEPYCFSAFTCLLLTVQQP